MEREPTTLFSIRRTGQGHLMPRRRQSALVDTRVIYCGDCLEKLKKMPDACIDLVYIDPPFNSNRNYEVFWGEAHEKRSFEDRHASTQAYIEFMRPRCVELARVLKPTGSFYFHSDWHACHYVKVMLDQIFGENGFQNEIVWKRTHAHGNAGRKFGNVTDSIFFYVASKRYTWNQQYSAFTEEYIERRFSNADADGRRWQSVTLRNPGVRPNLRYPFTASNGVTYQPHPNGWSCDQERMDRYDKEKRLHFPSKVDGQLRLKMYLDESPGPRIHNLWDDIPPVNSQAFEAIGYPTQKPLPLLERIIQTSTNQGDIVLDAFCGCGTAIAAAEKLGRNWIGIDVSPRACSVMAKRIRDVCHIEWDEALWRANRGFAVFGLPRSEESLKTIPHDEFEEWAVIALRGQPNKSKVRDMGIDGRIYPVSDLIEKGPKMRQKYLSFVDVWYPVQVKQTAKVGRPEIDKFEAVMIREDRDIGFFVGFEFTRDAEVEVRAFERKSGRKIILRTVRDLLAEAAA